MKNILYLPFLFLLALACKKYPDPSRESLKSLQFTKIGDYQRGLAGQYLNDSIGIMVYNVIDYYNTRNYRVVFDPETSNSTLSGDTVYTNSSGKALVRWKPGTGSTLQKIVASIYDTSGNFLTADTLKAYVFSKNRWNKVTLPPDNVIWDLAVDTIHNTTIMTACFVLYRQGPVYFNWEPVTIEGINGVTDVENDSLGNLYIATRNGSILTSTDGALTWNFCTNPQPDNSGRLCFAVTPGGDLWVSTDSINLLHSGDRGKTWENVSAGLPSGGRLGEIVRINDDSLLLKTTQHLMYRSVDKGKSWNIVQEFSEVANIFRIRDGSVIVYYYANGFKIGQSTDHGKTFENIHTWETPNLEGLRSYCVYYRGKYYLISDRGMVTTTDFRTFTPYWEQYPLFSVYLDNNNVFIVRGADNVVYYRKN